VTTVVLNGASSAGKTSIGLALQERWNGPLLLTGIDSFLAGWSDRYFAGPGEPASSGFSVVPVDGGLLPQPGADGRRLYRAAHRAWLGVHDSGLDQVVDHVLLDGASKAHAQRVLSGPGFLWVGVRCDVEELVRREEARGNRTAGFAAGTAAVVHTGMTYDLEVDSSGTSAAHVAELLLAQLGQQRHHA
jgi:chloramphenicol 3-O phosphotransferase